MLTMWLFSILSLLAPVLGSSITNGTCYFKAGKEADEIYSPCGNTINGTWPCCQLGDKCNDHNSCTWSNGRDPIYTYVAGCTDPTYEDEHCPFKGEFSTYEWVGLTFTGCSITEDNTVNWDGCENDGYPRVRVSPESQNCTCQDSEQPLLSNVPTGLVAMGWLPLTKMGTIRWEAGYERTDPVVASTAPATDSSISTRTLASPTTRDTSTTSSSLNSSSSTTKNSTITTATPTTANGAAIGSVADGDDSTSPLTTGEKAAIGIGAVLGSALFVFMGIGAIRIRQKPRQEKKEFVDDDSPQNQEKDVLTPASEPAMLDAESTQRDPALSDQKSELPGSPPNPSLVGTVSPISEVPLRNDEHVIVYQPFRYRNADVEGSAELPQAERPSWAGVDCAAYRAQQARNENYYQAGHGFRDGRGGTGGAHELPG